MCAQDISGKAYWLKMQRKRSGLTQKELARLAGTSLRSIQSYEQGTRNLSGASVELVQALCRVLNCSEADILSYPGSRAGVFAQYSDEVLCRLYRQNIAGEEVPRDKLPPELESLLAPEFKTQLTEEMAARFYQSYTGQQKEKET